METEKTLHSETHTPIVSAHAKAHNTTHDAAYEEGYDVIVVGGGPAGSTCATALAKKGFSVLMLEKEVHPRFHIGESLLPANMPLLERLGVAEEVKAIGMLKLGIEFNSPDHKDVSYVEFAEGCNKDLSWAYQVRRSEFDEILFRNAQKNGVTAIEGCTVKEVSFDAQPASSVQVSADFTNADSPIKTRKVFTASFMVDASGRDTFLATKLKTKNKNKKHNSAALFGHFENVKRLTGDKEGYISIFWFEHGWFWFIPLSGGVTSVGAVCWPYYLQTRKERTLEAFLWDTIQLCPQLSERMPQAKWASKAYATGNYSYSSKVSHGKNYILIGDAFAFVDPVFSSGVMLAMNSGFNGADVVEATLRKAVNVPAILKKFHHEMVHGPKTFSWFIHRVTNPFVKDMFMQPQNVLGAKEGVLGLLSGDIFENSKIWRGVKVFKLAYYVSSLFGLGRAWRAKKVRRYNIRDTGVQVETLHQSG